MPSKGKNTPRSAGPNRRVGESGKRPQSPAAPTVARPVSAAPPTAKAAPAPRPVAAGPIILAPVTPISPTGFAMTNFENMTSTTRDQFEKAQQTAYKTVGELTRFQKENWEAFVSASQIATKGAETLSKAWLAFSKEALENAASTAKALIGAKTLSEAVDLQQGFAKTHFDKFVAESTKLSEIGVKMANEAIGPLSARLNVAVEKILKPVAA